MTISCNLFTEAGGSGYSKLKPTNKEIVAIMHDVIGNKEDVAGVVITAQHEHKHYGFWDFNFSIMWRPKS